MVARNKITPHSKIFILNHFSGYSLKQPGLLRILHLERQLKRELLFIMVRYQYLLNYYLPHMKKFKSKLFGHWVILLFFYLICKMFLLLNSKFLGNIAGDSAECRDHVLDSEVLPPLLQ